MTRLRDLVSQAPNDPLDGGDSPRPVTALLWRSDTTPEAIQTVVEAGASPLEAYCHFIGSYHKDLGINLLLAWQRLTPDSRDQILAKDISTPYTREHGIIIDSVETIIEYLGDRSAWWRLTAIRDRERNHGAIVEDSISAYMRAFDQIETPNELQYFALCAKEGVQGTYRAVLVGAQRARTMATSCFGSGGGGSRPDSSRYFPVAAYDGDHVASSRPTDDTSSTRGRHPKQE